MDTKKIISFIVLAGLLVLIAISFRGTKEEVVFDYEEDYLISDQVIQKLDDGEYVVSSEGSTINWEGRKKIVESKHNGTIAVKSGTFTILDGSVDTGDLVINMQDIALHPEDNGGDKLLGHLKSDDFFSTEMYPEAQVAVKGTNGNTLEIELTIKEITNPIDLEITALEKIDNGRVLIMGTSIIDRSLFDVRFGSESFFQDLGDQIIDDMINIEVMIVAAPTSVIE